MNKLISLLIVLSFLFSNITTYAEETTTDTVEFIVRYRTEEIRLNDFQNVSELSVFTEEFVSDKLTNIDDMIVVDTISNSETFEVTQLISLETTDVEKTTFELNSIDEVVFAEPNYKVYANDYDPGYSNQWAINNNSSYGVNIENVWDITQGSDILVAVLDSGIDINHPDLSANIYSNQSELDDGIDNDQNGYIDDFNGWNFTDYEDSENNGNNIVYDNTMIDGEYVDAHGTHVAGIIAGSKNGVGIQGVASSTKILPVKFLEHKEGTVFDAIKAIEYAEIMGADIVNCSWSGNNYSQFLYDCIRNSDMLFVCAAGNEYSNVSEYPVYPACYELENIISVAATNSAGNLADFSNHGNIDIAAPGVDIYSTLPEDTYGNLSGTSMAAPYVSASAALLLSVSPELSAEDVKKRILDCATENDKLNDNVSANAQLNISNSILTTIEPDDMQSPRYGAESIVINNELYVVGGYSDGIYSNTVIKYNPVNKSWDTVAQMPVGLAHPAIASYNDCLYIFGGYSESPLNNVYVLNLETNEWTSTTLMPKKLYASAYTVTDDSIYIMGGVSLNGYSETVYRYDFQTNIWNTISELPKKSANSSAINANGAVYLMGGVSENEVLDDIYKFNLENNTFELVGNMNSPRKDFQSVFFDDDIYIFGGSNSYNVTTSNQLLEYNKTKGVFIESVLDSVERFDVNTEKIETADRLNKSISGFTASVYYDKIYLIGGWNGLYDNSVSQYFGALIPENITVRTVGDTVKIKWSKISSAESYNIEIDDVVYSTQSNNYNIASDETKEHKIRVQAVNGNRKSLWSDYVYHYENSTMLDAKVISNNEQVSDRLYKTGQVRWYKIDNSTPGKLTVSLSNIPQGCEYSLQLCNSNGNMIAAGIYNSENLSINDFVVEGYSYYLKVASVYGGDNENSYSLNISLSTDNEESVNDKLSAAYLKPSAMEESSADVEYKDISEYEGEEPQLERVDNIPDDELNNASTGAGGENEYIPEDILESEDDSLQLLSISNSGTTEDSITYVGGSKTYSVTVPANTPNSSQKCKVVIAAVPETKTDRFSMSWTSSNTNYENFWYHYNWKDNGEYQYYLTTILNRSSYANTYSYTITCDYLTSGSSGEYTVYTYILVDSSSVEDYNKNTNNDNASTSDYLTVTTNGSNQIQGKIDTPYDQDFYRVYLSANQKLSVAVNTPEGKKYGVYVYDNQGNTTTTTPSQVIDGGWYEDGTAYATIESNTSRYYLIKINSIDGSYSADEKYTLTTYVYNKNAIGDLEVNNKFDYADGLKTETLSYIGTNIKPAIPIDFCIDSPIDEDMYAIDVSAGDKISVYMDIPDTDYIDSTHRYRINMYYDDENGDRWVSRYNNPNSTKSKYITFVAETSGTHYVSVESQNNQYDYTMFGKLTITKTPSSAFDILEDRGENCSNDFIFVTKFSLFGYEFGVATAVEMNNSVSANFDNELDVDWYKYKVGSGNQIKQLGINFSNPSMQNSVDMIITDEAGEILYFGTNTNTYEFKANETYYIGLCLKDNVFNNVKGDTSYSINLGSNVVSDLWMKKVSGGNTLYVNNPETITDLDIIQNLTSNHKNNNLIYRQKEVSGVNTLYVTHSGRKVNDAPTDSFYYDIDFENNTSESIYIQLDKLNYMVTKKYSDLADLYTERLRDDGVLNRTVELPANSHKLLFKDILNGALEIPISPPDNDYYFLLGIFLDFEVLEGEEITVNTLAAYDTQYLDLLTWNDNVYANVDTLLDGAKFVYSSKNNARSEHDVNRKMKGIDRTSLPEVVANMNYVIDDTVPAQRLKVNIHDEFYSSGINNPKDTWITCCNPFNDLDWGIYYAVPSNLFGFEYEDIYNGESGIWMFNYMHLNPNSFEYNNSYLYSRDVNGELNSEINDTFLNHLKGQAAVSRPSSAPVALPNGISYGEWQDVTMMLGNWGITHTYNINISNVGSNERLFKYFMEMANFVGVSVKVTDNTGKVIQNYSTTVVSDYNSDKSDFVRTQKELCSVELFAGKSYTITLSILNGVGTTGFGNYMYIE